MNLPEYLVIPIYADTDPASNTKEPIENSGAAAYSSDSAITV